MKESGWSRCSLAGCRNMALSFSDYCWEHLTDKEAYAAKISEMFAKGADLSRANLKKIVMRDLNVSRANLSGSNLSQAELAGSRFFDCNFEGAHLVGTDLADSDLSHCDFKGADFTRADLSKARLWNANLRAAILTETRLNGADLWNANLYDAKIWRTNLDSVISLGQRNFSGSPHRLMTARISEKGLYSAEEAYRDLKRYFLANGMYDDAGWASFKEKTSERLIMKKRRSLHYIPSLLMSVLCGYGEKPSRIILSALAAVLLYTAVYSALGAVESSRFHGYAMRLSDYLYFSTATFTTVGYGDFVPKQSAFFKLLAASEAFAGVFLSGLFVFTLARKYTAR